MPRRSWVLLMFPGRREPSQGSRGCRRFRHHFHHQATNYQAWLCAVDVAGVDDDHDVADKRSALTGFGSFVRPTEYVRVSDHGATLISAQNISAGADIERRCEL